MVEKQPVSVSRFGVVEGYYGRTWSSPDRDRCLSVFPQIDLAHYLYAPKSDAYLRKNWREPYPDAEFEQLASTLSAASNGGLHVGVGFSPFGLNDLGSPAERERLLARIEEFNQLKLGWLGVFFDDMDSIGESMAANQLAIVDLIAERSSAERIIVCPSYYTRDPILEKVFGARPVNYWRELGRGLDPHIDFFWTGEQVCSRSYDRFDLEAIADEMQRLPSLWDNYPVNDGERMSQFLHLQPFNPHPEWLERYTRWHFANPMNQPFSSLLPLSTLSVASGGAEAVDEQQRRWSMIAGKYGGDIAERLQIDCEAFSQRGLDAMSEGERFKAQAYYADKCSPIATEIHDWLCGEYVFDPACLTG